jgi:hypothetical protein
MSNLDKDALNFVANFFDGITTPEEGIKGGKRKQSRKNQRNKNKKARVGGAPPGTPLLPTPLNTSTISLLEQIQSATEKKTLSLSAGGAGTGDINSQLSEKLQGILAKLNANNGAVDIALTEEEMMIISLYSSVMELSQVKEAAQQIKEQAPAQEQIQDQAPAQEQIERGQMQEQDQDQGQQIQAQPQDQGQLLEQQIRVEVMPGMQEIADNTVAEVEGIQALYEANANPEQISRASTSAFINAFGRMKALLTLIVNYETTLSEFDESLQASNPKLHLMLSTIYSCISFLLFTIFKLFKFLMNFRAGQIYVSYVFYRLYSNGNPIVVFIANTILYLSKVTGVTATMTALMEMCKKKVMEAIPAILTSAALNSFLTNTIVKALMDPTVLRNFVQSLSPELAGQLVQNALPQLTQGLTQGLIEGATPAITQGITQGLIEGLAPALTQGITQGVIEGARPLLIEGIKEGATQGARLLVEQQAKTAIMSKIGDLALRFGVGAVAGYLGADAGTVGLLTNGPAGLLTNAGGGKKTKKIRRNKKSKHINKKNKNTNNKKKTKTRKHL